MTKKEELKQKFIIVDIDDTICKMYHGRVFNDISLAYKDQPIEYVIDIINSLIKNKGLIPIFISNRVESSRDVTEAWLERFIDIKPSELVLYLQDFDLYDTSSSSDKTDLIEKFINDFEIQDISKEVMCAIDNENEHIETFEKYGLTTLKVGGVD
jgi:predicted secreted acid phosphatase